MSVSLDDIIVRKAETTEEFEEYAAIVRAKGNMDLSSLHDLDPETGTYPLLVALHDGAVVGGAGLVRRDDRVYLDSFIVAPEWRHQGVGTAIVEASLAHLGEEDTLVALVAAYVGIQKRKFAGMGFSVLYRSDAEARGVPYKDDDYAMKEKNRGCSVFVIEKAARR